MLRGQGVRHPHWKERKVDLNERVTFLNPRFAHEYMLVLCSGPFMGSCLVFQGERPAGEELWQASRPSRSCGYKQRPREASPPCWSERQRTLRTAGAGLSEGQDPEAGRKKAGEGLQLAARGGARIPTGDKGQVCISSKSRQLVQWTQRP